MSTPFLELLNIFNEFFQDLDSHKNITSTPPQNVAQRKLLHTGTFIKTKVDLLAMKYHRFTEKSKIKIKAAKQRYFEFEADKH